MSRKNTLTVPLRTAWPKAFDNGPNPKPLKLGVHLDMAAGAVFTP
jgi:ProP effector